MEGPLAWSTGLRYHVECEFVSSSKITTYKAAAPVVGNGDISSVVVVDNWAGLSGDDAVVALSGSSVGQT
jgi:hypothetical protein